MKMSHLMLLVPAALIMSVICGVLSFGAGPGDVNTSWSDEWFLNDSVKYNKALAAASITLSNATYDTDENNNPVSSSIEEMLIKDGFDTSSIRSYNYDYSYTKSDNNIVAYTFASKNIGSQASLIAVVIRGTTDPEEWRSNINLSNGADSDDATYHYGFYESEAKLNNDLTSYIDEIKNSGNYNTENLRFLVTGHSRGGAVADILAAQLNSSYGKDHIYAYTFGSPAVSVDAGSTGYENIFNIINSKDIVARLTFTGRGFKRYGTDITLPANSYKSSLPAHDPEAYLEAMNN